MGAHVSNLKKADSPLGLAYRMASYNKDAAYIRSMVEREHGKAPSIKTIEKFIVDRRKEVEKFRNTCENRDLGQDSWNDNGEHFSPRYIGPEPDPHELRAYKRWDGGLSWIKVEQVRAEGKPKPPADTSSAKLLCHAVASAFGVKYEDLIGLSRIKRLVAARAVAAKLLRERNPQVYSFPRIARILGRKDHSTVINYLDTWDERCRHIPAMVTVYRSMGGAANEG